MHRLPLRMVSGADPQGDIEPAVLVVCTPRGNGHFRDGVEKVYNKPAHSHLFFSSFVAAHVSYNAVVRALPRTSSTPLYIKGYPASHLSYEHIPSPKAWALLPCDKTRTPTNTICCHATVETSARGCRWVQSRNPLSSSSYPSWDAPGVQASSSLENGVEPDGRRTQGRSVPKAPAKSWPCLTPLASCSGPSFSAVPAAWS